MGDFKSSFIWGDSTYELMDDPDLNSPEGVSSDYTDSDVTCDDVLPRVMISDDGITPQWCWNIGFGQCGMTYSTSESSGGTVISFEIYWNGQTRSVDDTFFILLNQVKLTCDTPQTFEISSNSLSINSSDSVTVSEQMDFDSLLQLINETFVDNNETEN